MSRFKKAWRIEYSLRWALPPEPCTVQAARVPAAALVLPRKQGPHRTKLTSKPG